MNSKPVVEGAKAILDIVVVRRRTSVCLSILFIQRSEEVLVRNLFIWRTQRARSVLVSPTRSVKITHPRISNLCGETTPGNPSLHWQVSLRKKLGGNTRFMLLVK